MKHLDPSFIHDAVISTLRTNNVGGRSLFKVIVQDYSPSLMENRDRNLKQAVRTTVKSRE